MNREIKFRAWDKLNNTMLPDMNPYANWLELPIMQFIGIKDKFDTLIYEGDIIEVPLVSEEGDINFDKFQIGEIVYEGVSFYFKSHNLDGDIEMVSVDYYDENLIEVIGNIYETPEKLINL